jgi:hypothetical protein
MYNDGTRPAVVFTVPRSEGVFFDEVKALFTH